MPDEARGLSALHEVELVRIGWFRTGTTPSTTDNAVLALIGHSHLTLLGIIGGIQKWLPVVFEEREQFPHSVDEKWQGLIDPLNMAVRDVKLSMFTIKTDLAKADIQIALCLKKRPPTICPVIVTNEVPSAIRLVTRKVWQPEPLDPKPFRKFSVPGLYLILLVHESENGTDHRVNFFPHAINSLGTDDEPVNDVFVAVHLVLLPISGKPSRGLRGISAQLTN